MRTVLIDDDTLTLRLLALQLQHLGYGNITQCARPHEALALLESEFETIDLVFCDLQMPDIDGVQFVRHLARIGYRGSMVLVSGEDERILQTVRKLAQAHHIDVLGTLQKPFSLTQLEQVLLDKAARTLLKPQSVQRTYTIDELQRAIDEGELINYYQPKVSMATGALVGAETLVRWQRPTVGLVMPDQFISRAEEYGLIDDLTRIVLAAAIRQARRWRDNGLDLHIAINVSMDNLAALNFPDVVAQLARDSGVAPTQVVLEVTESRLMHDPCAALDVLTRLRLKRIGLSIDDFGTGHSSLAQLRDIPFDELKLDRSFINGASHDAGLRAIVEPTLDMARHLGMRTVAEGIETRDDWDLLRTCGCDVAQGYFIARPMPASELLPWHAGWAQRWQEMNAVA